MADDNIRNMTGALENAGFQNCPVCKGMAITFGDTFALRPAGVPGKDEAEAEPVLFRAMTCQTCGYTRFHDEQVMRAGRMRR
jgi:hypothetical protein